MLSSVGVGVVWNGLRNLNMREWKYVKEIEWSVANWAYIPAASSSSSNDTAAVADQQDMVKWFCLRNEFGNVIIHFQVNLKSSCYSTFLHFMVPNQLITSIADRCCLIHRSVASQYAKMVRNWKCWWNHKKRIIELLMVHDGWVKWMNGDCLWSESL